MGIGRHSILDLMEIIKEYEEDSDVLNRLDQKLQELRDMNVVALRDYRNGHNMTIRRFEAFLVYALLGSKNSFCRTGVWFTIIGNYETPYGNKRLKSLLKMRLPGKYGFEEDDKTDPHWFRIVDSEYR